MTKFLGDIAIDVQQDRKKLAEMPYPAAAAILRVGYQTATDSFHTKMNELIVKSKEWADNYATLNTNAEEAKLKSEAARQKADKEFDLFEANSTMMKDLMKSWDTEKAQLKADIDELKGDLRKLRAAKSDEHKTQIQKLDKHLASMDRFFGPLYQPTAPEVGVILTKFAQVLQPIVDRMASGTVQQRSTLRQILPEGLNLNALFDDLSALKSTYDAGGLGAIGIDATRPATPVFGPLAGGTAELIISPRRPGTSGTDTTALTVEEQINEQNKREKSRLESGSQAERSKREKLAPQPYQMTSDVGKRILQRCQFDVTFSEDSTKMYWLMKEIDNIGKRRDEDEFHRLIQTAIVGSQLQAAPTPPYCLICKLNGKGTITGDDKTNLEDCKNCASEVKSKPAKSEDRVSVYALFAEGKMPAHAVRMNDGKLTAPPNKWEFEEGDDVLYVVKERTRKADKEVEVEDNDADADMYS